jgi:hypothetical protein
MKLYISASESVDGALVEGRGFERALRERWPAAAIRRSAEAPEAHAVDWEVAMAVDRRSDRVVVCDPQGVRVLELALACGDIIELPFAGMRAAAFSPDGQRLALAHEEEGVMVLRGEMLELAWQAAGSDPVPRARVCFSASGTTLAVNTGNGVTCYESETGAVAREVAMPHFPLFDHAASPGFDGWGLLVEGGASLYTADPLPDSDRFIHGQSILPAPASAMVWVGMDELWVATRRGELAQVEPRLRTVFEHEGEVSALAVSAEGRHLASLWSDGMLRVIRLPIN